MFASLILLFSLAVAVSHAFAQVNATKGALPTVPEVDIAKYVGLWYQMAADEIVYQTFEKDSYCVTGFYGDNGDGTISVRNYAKKHGPTGEDSSIDGYAYQKDAKNDPGKLLVVFTSGDSVPFPAPYWIVSLGPVNEHGKYDYSIVTDSVSASLYILARDVDVYNAKYKAEVSKKVAALGFVGKTAPIDTYQGKDCVYESTVRRQQIDKFQNI